MPAARCLDVGAAGQGVFTCGTGRNAQLGVGDLEDYQVPVPVQELPVGASYIDAAAGWTQNFLLTSTSTMMSSCALVCIALACRCC